MKRLKKYIKSRKEKDWDSPAPPIAPGLTKVSSASTLVQQGLPTPLPPYPPNPVIGTYTPSEPPKSSILTWPLAFNYTNKPFQYTALPLGRHFRVLQLLRRQNEFETPYQQVTLHGILHTASLDEGVEYQALSYTWGDPTPCETIFINGSVMRITANCAAALRRMMRGKVSRMMWVDSICINQGSYPEALEERAGQVARMDEIYGAAYSVLVFLGEGNAQTEEGFSALKRLSAAYIAGLSAGESERNAKLAEYEAVVKEVMEPLETFGKLSAVFNLPWFRRAWVLQEIALAKKATFYCGNHLMEFHNLASSSNFTLLLPPHRTTGEMRQYKEYLEHHDRLRRHVMALEAGEDFPELTGLTNLIMLNGMRLQATKPEDKVYALYGVCKRLGYTLPEPNYFKPLTDLFIETARCMLQQDNELNFLLLTLGTSSMAAGLPSWVPNLGPSLFDMSENDPPTFTASHGSACCAGGTSPIAYTLPPSGKILGVKGRLFDRIAELGDVWKLNHENMNPRRKPGLANLMRIIESWGNVLVSLKDEAGQPAYPTGQPLQRAFAELLMMAGMNKEGLPADVLDTMLNCFMVLWAQSKHADQEMRRYLVYPLDMGQDLYTFEEFVISPTMFKMVVEVSGRAGWKAVGRTGRNYLGLFPYGARFGDVVAVLQGCAAPVVLRKCGDGYIFIGAVYVQGIMGGEFWETGKTGNDEWFLLE
ncbi:HET-domain-containing protein [Aulographum hederae CBS 113979]|uniref:HET-domain-containing protein n=1 Tax=Aulographum hederae CBS 113979 TaxID=1176131 RepID=A0A6G1HB46_9PEZI|nr:HET-domain-containing protein [Aulographum hederae CBS 113979]